MTTEVAHRDNAAGQEAIMVRITKRRGALGSVLLLSLMVLAPQPAIAIDLVTSSAASNHSSPVRGFWRRLRPTGLMAKFAPNLEAHLRGKDQIDLQRAAKYSDYRRDGETVVPPQEAAAAHSGAMNQLFSAVIGRGPDSSLRKGDLYGDPSGSKIEAIMPYGLPQRGVLRTILRRGSGRDLFSAMRSSALGVVLKKFGSEGTLVTAFRLMGKQEAALRKEVTHPGNDPLPKLETLYERGNTSLARRISDLFQTAKPIDESRFRATVGDDGMIKVYAEEEGARKPGMKIGDSDRHKTMLVNIGITQTGPIEFSGGRVEPKANKF